MHIDDCLVHPSYKKNPSFQRLEFFGDKIVSFYLSKYLMFNENLSEGEMTIKMSQMVNGHCMANIASFLTNQIKYSGDLNDSILSDCLEAWIGFQFLSGEDIEKLIYNLWKEELNKKIEKNAKNILQETMQKRKQEIFYSFEKKDNTFICKITSNGKTIISSGKSKKEASQNAAEKFLLALNKKTNIK